MTDCLLFNRFLRKINRYWPSLSHSLSLTLYLSLFLFRWHACSLLYFLGNRLFNHVIGWLSFLPRVKRSIEEKKDQNHIKIWFLDVFFRNEHQSEKLRKCRSGDQSMNSVARCGIRTGAIFTESSSTLGRRPQRPTMTKTLRNSTFLKSTFSARQTKLFLESG